MNSEEMVVIEFLEDVYTEAHDEGDWVMQIRLARAIAAFKSDPEDAPEAVFTGDFIEKYYDRVLDKT